MQFYKWLAFVFIWFFTLSTFGQKTKKDSLENELTYYNLASDYADSSQYEKALPLLKKAIKLKPDYWEAYNLSGKIKVKLHQNKEAQKDLDKAEKIAPLNYESLKWKGINFYYLNQFNDARYYLDTAAFYENDEKMDDAELYFYRASLMFKGKSYKQALLTCEAATEFAPKYVEVIQLKGEIRFEKKEYNYAIKEFNEAIALMTELNTNYYAYKLRAKSKFEVGDYTGAIKDWNVYLDANPDEEEALISRASAKINANDNSGAIVDLDAAIKLNSKNAVSYCYRGVAKGGNRQYVEALKDLDYSIKLKFDYSTAYVNRAAIKMASKDKRGACEDLQKADSLGNEMAVQLYERYCRDNR